MAIKHFHVSRDSIRALDDLRFSPAFHYVGKVFETLNAKYGVKTLRELDAKISSGSYIDTYLESGQGVPYVRVGNIKPYGMDVHVDNLKYVSSDCPSKIKLKEKDVVVSRTQATPDKLGVASIVDCNQAGSVISQHVSKIAIDSVSPYYLVAYLNSNFYKAQTALATHGDTRVEMTHTQMYNVRVFVPVGDVASSIESDVIRIEEYNREALELIEKARAIVRTKVLSSIHVENKNAFSVPLSSFASADMWTPKFSFPIYVGTNQQIKKNWDTTCIGEITDLFKGDEVGSENYLDYLQKEADSVPFIRTSDIVNFEIDMYPDYYVPRATYVELGQNFKPGDVLFSKDAKIGQVGLVTEADDAIFGSGFCALRLNKKGVEKGLSQEYLFTVLSIKEIGIYESKRRSVVASTIPHLREDRVNEMEIPILDQASVDEITNLVREAFRLKAERKRLIAQVRKTIDGYFDI